ncbi:2-keto-4-pentenoate hydratase [Burkholderia sp. 22PA0099]|uniref:2-keto-4-pentenoate hydratase n=1 Tax=Burkholderia sp. 22PA0099 TaxID=3237372 RepID=UPI0039C43BCA
MTSRLELAASALRQARLTSTPIDPVSRTHGIDDIETAYAVAAINVDHAIAAGRRIVGRKIGLTSFAVQQQLGVDQPDFGTLFSDMEYGSGQTISIDRLIQPKVETEIALILGSDLQPESLTREIFVRNIEAAIPAFEIVDSAIANWDITIADTIADNASSGLYVLGKTARSFDETELATCRMQCTMDGTVVSTGSGAACLGNPLNAAWWLVKTLTSLGQTLHAGDIILTGALGPMVPLETHSEFAAEIEGFGTVQFRTS